MVDENKPGNGSTDLVNPDTFARIVHTLPQGEYDIPNALRKTEYNVGAGLQILGGLFVFCRGTRHSSEPEQQRR
jgi:hypothetical protein